MISRLEDSFRQIQDFSDNVSHELRIPLSILRGQTELSLKRPRSADEYKRILRSNLEEIIRMEEIVEKLLFLSKADRGEIEINRYDVDISALLRGTYEQFNFQAREKKIDIKLKLNGPISVRGDDVLLSQLLLNLVQNAITYTPKGGEILLSACRNDTEAIISIADTGSGIPEEEISHIFDKFYQVDKSRSGGGHGLGLSICKWIAEAHQGRITVKSSLGAGSEFTLYLPV